MQTTRKNTGGPVVHIATAWPAPFAQLIKEVEEKLEGVYFYINKKDGRIMEHSLDGNLVALATSPALGSSVLADEAPPTPSTALALDVLALSAFGGDPDDSRDDSNDEDEEKTLLKR